MNQPENQLNLKQIAIDAYPMVLKAREGEVDLYREDVTKNISARYSRSGQNFDSVDPYEREKLVREEVAFESNRFLAVYKDGSTKIMASNLDERAVGFDSIVAKAGLFHQDHVTFAVELEESNKALQSHKLAAYGLRVKTPSLSL